MITPTLKPLAALAVAATLAACDGVPIPDYPLSKSGAPESTLEIVNASGQPLRSLSYEGCNSLAKQTVLIEPGGPPSDKDRWVFPAVSGQCILVSPIPWRAMRISATQSGCCPAKPRPSWFAKKDRTGRPN